MREETYSVAAIDDVNTTADARRVFPEIDFVVRMMKNSLSWQCPRSRFPDSSNQP